MLTPFVQSPAVSSIDALAQESIGESSKRRRQEADALLVENEAL